MLLDTDLALRASIDPGVHFSGVAIWQGMTLFRAFYSRNADVKGNFFGLSELIIEHPQFYDRRHSIGKRQDLENLAAQVAHFKQEIKAPQYTEYLPREWKRQVDKMVMVERIKKRLSESEHARVEVAGLGKLSHNVYDAIGIGLHRFGRLRK